ncbi:MAG: hypothetical protein IT581_10340 [Verrucomicrobiales bacterium]|nr:hypothetical protein [Verrucomicrobiales bacterium]
MEWVLIGIARLLLPVLQALPLRWVAALGRAGGLLAWHLDRRHRRVALDNLRRCFGSEWPEDKQRRVARENFRRIGENYACGVRTAIMPWDQLKSHLRLGDWSALRATLAQFPNRSVIVAVGHFGNFELLTWGKLVAPELQPATTYRALRQEVATRWLLDLRRRSGCLFFERRRDAAALRETLRTRRVLLGLLADQHDGRGVRVPFMGHDAGTSTAPALYALRYHCPLFAAFCFRTANAQWQLELGPEIRTRDDAGKARPLEAIARDMNAAFEGAIRRDPANWFWVHRRWKPGPGPIHSPTPA